LKLTEQAVRHAAVPESGYSLIRDDELTGFALRVTSKGAKAFVLGYTVAGRERRMTVGSWPAWTAAAARVAVKALRRDIEQGVDPLEEKQQRQRDPTFSDLLAEYERIRVPHQRRGGDMMARLERDAVPALGKRKLSDVTRREIVSLLEKKAEAAPVSANRTHQAINAVFNFGVKRDWLAINPAANIDPPGGKEKPRDRVLSFDEIATVWQGLDGTGVTPTVRDILRFILLTAQRPGEACSLEWNELDGDMWNMPAEKAKSGKAQRVPIQGLAAELLEGRQQQRGVSWVYASRYRSRNASTSEASVANAVQLNNCFGVSHWTPHDLRRTAASHMASLKVAPHIIDRLLNHSMSSVTERHYNHYFYDVEKREALALWDTKLREITGR
jgi:integrase